MVTLHERRPEQVIQLLRRHREESFNFNSSSSTSCLATSARAKSCRAEGLSLPLQGSAGQLGGHGPEWWAFCPLPSLQQLAGMEGQWLRPELILCATVVTED